MMIQKPFHASTFQAILLEPVLQLWQSLMNALEERKTPRGEVCVAGEDLAIHMLQEAHQLSCKLLLLVPVIDDNLKFDNEVIDNLPLAHNLARLRTGTVALDRSSLDWRAQTQSRLPHHPSRKRMTWSAIALPACWI